MAEPTQAAEAKARVATPENTFTVVASGLAAVSKPVAGNLSSDTGAALREKIAAAFGIGDMLSMQLVLGADAIPDASMDMSLGELGIEEGTPITVVILKLLTRSFEGDFTQNEGKFKASIHPDSDDGGFEDIFAQPESGLVGPEYAEGAVGVAGQLRLQPPEQMRRKFDDPDSSAIINVLDQFGSRDNYTPLHPVDVGILEEIKKFLSDAGPCQFVKIRDNNRGGLEDASITYEAYVACHRLTVSIVLHRLISLDEEFEDAPRAPALLAWDDEFPLLV